MRVRHQPPQKRLTKKEREAQLRERQSYMGWTPEEKECRRDGCAKLFLPKAPAQAYCSDACRDEAVRGQRRITDKGKRERAKQRRQGDGELTRTCKLDDCEVVFVPEHARTAYCSDEHKAEAIRKQKRRSSTRAGALPPPGPDTVEAIAEIERLEQRLGGKLPDLQRDYLVVLIQRVNRDPACPQHVYDRLERLLGLPPAEGSTMPRPDASS